MMTTRNRLRVRTGENMFGIALTTQIVDSDLNVVAKSKPRYKDILVDKETLLRVIDTLHTMGFCQVVEHRDKTMIKLLEE